MERFLGARFKWALGAVLVGLVLLFLYSVFFDKEADAHFKTALLARLVGQDVGAHAVGVARDMERTGDQWRCGRVDAVGWREWRSRWSPFVFEQQVTVSDDSGDTVFEARFLAEATGRVLFEERTNTLDWTSSAAGMDQARLATEAVTDFDGILALASPLVVAEENNSLVRLVGGQAAKGADGVLVRCGIDGESRQLWARVTQVAQITSLDAQVTRQDGVIVGRQLKAVWVRQHDGVQVLVEVRQTIQGSDPTDNFKTPPETPQTVGPLGWARVRRLLGELLRGGLGVQ